MRLQSMWKFPQPERQQGCCWRYATKGRILGHASVLRPSFMVALPYDRWGEGIPLQLDTGGFSGAGRRQKKSRISGSQGKSC